jgi:hypothetical protein
MTLTRRLETTPAQRSARRTPRAAAMSFCHQPCSCNSHARLRRHSPESLALFMGLMAHNARKFRTLCRDQ